MSLSQDPTFPYGKKVFMAKQTVTESKPAAAGATATPEAPMSSAPADKETKEAIDLLKELDFRPLNQIPFEMVVVDPIDGVTTSPMQPREVTNGDNLIDSIAEQGLETPLSGWMPEGEKRPQVLQGNRRLDAIRKLHAANRERFLRVFPDGKVPMKIFKGITSREAVRILMDHSMDRTKVPLTSKIEALNTVKHLYNQGYTERQVMGLTWQGVSPIMARRDKFEELRTKMAAATSVKEKMDILFNSQKGNYQFLHRMSEAPDELLDFWKDAVKGAHQGFNRQKDYEDLVMIHNKEMSDDRRSQNPKGYNRQKPGPQFRQAFADAKASIKEPEKSTGPKPLTKSAMDEFLDKEAVSKHSQTLAKIFLGLTPKGGFSAIDTQLSMIETAYDIDQKTMDLIVDFLVKGQKPLSASKREALEKVLA